MSKIGVIKKPEAIRTFLTRLGLWEGAIAVPPAHAPPLPTKALAWGVDAWDGRLVEFESGFNQERLPTQRPSKAPRECYYTYTLEDSGVSGSARSEAEESQVPALSPPTQQREDGLLLVFDGDPPPPDAEPVFWTD